MSHASTPTSTTCVFPSTVARPAPTYSIELCHRSRSAAKKAPASHAQTRVRHGRRGQRGTPAGETGRAHAALVLAGLVLAVAAAAVLGARLLGRNGDLVL